MYNSWTHAEENKRSILRKSDTAVAITRTYVFDLLVDVVSTEDVKEHVLACISASSPYYQRLLKKMRFLMFVILLVSSPQRKVL